VQARVVQELPEDTYPLVSVASLASRCLPQGVGSSPDAPARGTTGRGCCTARRPRLRIRPQTTSIWASIPVQRSDTRIYTHLPKPIAGFATFYVLGGSGLQTFQPFRSAALPITGGSRLMMDEVATSRDDAVIVRRYNEITLRLIAFTLLTGVRARSAWRGIRKYLAIVLSGNLQVPGCTLGEAAPLLIRC
jgi:hypothetical protein